MIFLTGGTGFIGRSLIRKLLREGKPLRALYRTDGRRFIEDPKLTWVPGEIGRPDTLHRGMEGADTVIHLVGTLIEPGEQTFEKVHVEGTETLLEAARRAGVRRLLHMSALGARPDAASRYHRTKWKAEEAVRASPLGATVFRPSLVFGKEDASLNRLAKIVARSPFVPVAGTGQNRLQPVWVEDLSNAFVQSLDDPRADGKTYPLCGPKPYTFNQLVDLVLQVKKSGRPKLHIPIFLLKGPALVSETLFRHPPLTRDQLILLQEDNICSDNTAGKELGITFRRMEEILPTYLS